MMTKGRQNSLVLGQLPRQPLPWGFERFVLAPAHRSLSVGLALLGDPLHLPDERRGPGDLERVRVALVSDNQ